MKLRSLALAAALATSGIPFATEASAAELIIDSNGELTGATGVDVGGTLYDVAFQDGTCIDLFDGCDSTTDFAFSTGESAEAAGQALLDQVFIGTFNKVPELTLGCEPVFPGVCAAIVPYSFEFGQGAAIGAVNYAGLFEFVTPDEILTGESIGRSDNTGDLAPITWAVFTPSSAVPEPSTWAMMLLGFGAAGMALRRRDRAHAASPDTEGASA